MSRANRPEAAALPDPRERRQSVRLHFSADLTFASGANFYAGRARDISAGGLFFETSAALQVGDRLWIRLRVLGQPFAVTAEVCWLLYDRAGRPRGAGVRFLNTPPPMRESIEMYMRCRDPIEFDYESSSLHPPPLPPKR
jgi:uncharacterized protein (TIGR02266 family)